MKNPLEDAITILVVQPDDARRKRYETLLTGQGYSVHAVATGEEGIETAYRSAPRLVIADIEIPDITGYQICRLLKADPVTQAMAVVLLSEADNKLDKFWGYKAGADAFLHHDTVDAKLLPQVSTLLGIYSHRAIDSSLSAQGTSQLPATGKKSASSVDLRSRLNLILDRALIESTLMNEFRNLYDLVYDVGLLNYILFNLLESLIDYDLAVIFYNDKNRDPRVVTFHVPEGSPVTQTQIDAKAKVWAAELSDSVLVDRGETLQIEVVGTLTEGNDEADKAVKEKTVYLKEFYENDALIGALGLFSSTEKQFEEIFPIPLIEQEIRLLMRSRYLYSQAANLAITDGLTGLYNHRQFMLMLEQEFRRAKRYELSLSLAVIDIDHFKQFNDQWGHQVGDQMLLHVAQQACESFRNTDLVARYGGEELVVIFSETDIESAQNACERFQKTLALSPLIHHESLLTATVSIGLCTLLPDVEMASGLLKRADTALYEAKEAGRNQTVCFVSKEEAPPG